jgi:hypothetical protein
MKQQRKKPQQRLGPRMVGPLEDAAPSTSRPPPTEGMSESEVRTKFGVAAPVTIPRPLVLDLRRALMLSAEDLIALFDETPATKVGEREVFAEMDFLVPAEKLQHRIAKLKRLIDASKELWKALSKHVMKLRRAKDDILDKPTQEKYKREEIARQARSNAKLFKYRAALRNGNHREKIWRYQMLPVYFRNLVDDAMTFDDFGPWYYTNDKCQIPTGPRYKDANGKFKTPKEPWRGYWTTNLVRDVRTRLFDVSRYEVMMQLDQSTLELAGATEAEQHRTWCNVMRWENAVIKAGVFHGVLHPRADLLELLGLDPFVQAALSATETVQADDTENALALKTGGACFGGRIRSGGYRYHKNESSGNAYHRRPLESFDKGKPPAAWDDGTKQSSDTGSNFHNIHNDAESYDPR